MSSIEDPTEEIDGSQTFGKWVSLMSDSDRFDIEDGHVRCVYSTSDFMAIINGDAVIIVPSTFRSASQLIAFTILAHGSAHGYVELTIRRQSVRCNRLYRFAYVDGRHYEVMGVSEAFSFIHYNGLCDCNFNTNVNGIVDCYDSKLSTNNSGCPTIGVIKISSFFSSLVNLQSNKSRCTMCKIPSNYGQVLEYLMKYIDQLTEVDLNINKERIKKIEYLSNRITELKFQCIKTKILNQEMENYRYFVDGLVSSLLKNQNAAFRTYNHTIFVKIDKTGKIKYSPSERFMNSIINLQKQKILSLIAVYKEALIIMKTKQLFSKVL